jgi:dipeptidase
MCDTLVALPSATADGSTILAKNSDREPNEAQAICSYPRRQYPPGATVQCTYVAIPQVRETCAVLLSRPFWMWGAEMGANEHGVVIGNEAVFAKVKVPRTGLTGMDLLRLGLERAATADAALEVITSLLEEHGQGGSGGYQHKFFYHNSFLIADREAAWVLETVERHWAARRVADVASISNGLTIGNEFDLASPDLVSYAVKRGWCRGRDDFNFARCYSDFLYTRFSQCRARQPLTAAGLHAQAGSITAAEMMGLLRSHGGETRATGVGETTEGRPYTPVTGSNGDICMHYGDNLIRNSQTTGSLVAHLRPDGAATHWLTGTSAPCLGLFKPFYLVGSSAGGWEDVAAALGPEPGACYDPASLWWQDERLHRTVLLDYAARSSAFLRERDALEAAFRAEETARRGDPPAPLQRTMVASDSAFSARCVERARAAQAEWAARVEAMPATRRAPWAYRRRWNALSSACGMPPAATP